MEKILINDFMNFLKSKYNIIFFPLVVYIIVIEINYGYLTRLTFDFFFMNNAITDFLLTTLQPINLKFLEIFLKFNLTLFITYFVFYTKISRPKDLQEFLVIKRNLYIYPLIFIYILIFILVYNIIILTMTAARGIQPIINFYLAFISVEIVLYLVLVYPITTLIDRLWNMKTEKEFIAWNNGGFLKKEFVNCLSAGFETKEDFQKAKESGIFYPSQIKYYEDMKKGNYPSLEEYFESMKFNISDYNEWKKSEDLLKKPKNSTEVKLMNNMFDFKEYALYTLKSKYNFFYIFILVISIIDYYLQINGFYNRTNYFTKLTVLNFINRWIFLYGIIFISYLVYFSLMKKQERIVEIQYFKINSFFYPICYYY